MRKLVRSCITFLALAGIIAGSVFVTHRIGAALTGKTSGDFQRVTDPEGHWMLNEEKAAGLKKKIQELRDKLGDVQLSSFESKLKNIQELEYLNLSDLKKLRGHLADMLSTVADTFKEHEVITQEIPTLQVRVYNWLRDGVYLRDGIMSEGASLTLAMPDGSQISVSREAKRDKAGGAIINDGSLLAYAMYKVSRTLPSGTKYKIVYNGIEQTNFNFDYSAVRGPLRVVTE